MPLCPGSVLASHFSCSAPQWLQWAEFWEFVQNFFLYKNINDSLFKGEPVCDGHLHVPRAQGGRCPAIWVGSISRFQQHYEKYTIASDFIPLFWRWVPVAAIIAVNAFQTIGFVSVVQLLLAESFPTEIRFMRYHQISVYIIIDQTCEVRKSAPPHMHPE